MMFKSNSPQTSHGLIKRAKLVIIALFVVTLLQVSFTREAQATCCLCSPCPLIKAMHVITEFTLELDISTKVSTFFSSNILADFTNKIIKANLQVMTMELVTAGQAVVSQLGGMLDGQVANTAIREMQSFQAQTARDQIPAVSMCQFATLSKSIGSADRQKNLTQEVLSKRTMNRHLGVRGLAGAEGAGSKTGDYKSRFNQYLAAYCDPRDQNAELGEAYAGTCAAPDNRINRDVDYTGLLHTDLTLNVDFTVPAITEDKLDIFSMATNLYSSDLLIRPKDKILRNPKNRDDYLAIKSLIAKQSVAENSFHALVALKTENQFSNTSYYEDMHKLTKENYQDPVFFATLYDNPANVLRQKAAMQGIGLMQQRDLFESQIRSEMLLSILLETRLSEDTKDKLGGLK